MKPLLLFLFFFGWVPLASEASSPAYPPPSFHFATFRSASGTYVLEVDPSSRDGLGRSHCRLLSGGKEVWSKELPFTFHNAGVTDTGIVAGFGYTERRPFSNDPPNELRIVILDEKGEFRLDERHPSKDTGSQFGTWPPTYTWTPTGERIDLFPEANRVNVSFHGLALDRPSYDLITGKPVGEFKLDEATLTGVDPNRVSRWEMGKLAGLPLMLVRFQISSGDYPNDLPKGAVFAVVDVDGKEVWKKAFSTAYSIPKNPKASEKLAREVKGQDMILDTSKAGIFEVWFPKEKQRARFTITQKNGRWHVREAGTQPYTPPPPEPEIEPEPVAAPGPLPRLGEFILADRPAPNPLKGVFQWAIDGQGQFGFLREDGPSWTFGLVDAEGKLLLEMPEVAKMPAKDSGGEVMLAWSGGSTWIVAVTPIYDGKTSLWRLDAAKKTKQAITGANYAHVKALAAFPDGGFVSIGEYRKKPLEINPGETFLCAFDKAGRLRWRVGLSPTDEHQGITWSAEHVAVTSRGEIVVLDGAASVVAKLFDAKGKFLRHADLGEAFGTLPRAYGVEADLDGGFVVYYFREPVPVIRFNADGTVREKIRPVYAGGHLISPVGGVRIAPNGTVRIFDGSAFLELDDHHRATRAIGPLPDAEVLEAIGDARVDAHGHLFAVDERTMSVHVYDVDGKKVRVSKLREDEYRKSYESTFWPYLKVAPDGSLILREWIWERSAFFDKEGTRDGVKPALRVRAIGEEWHPRRDFRDLLVTEYERAHLMDDTGRIIAKLEHRADRKWLGYILDAAVAPDRSFALQHTDGNPDEGVDVTFFTEAGVPQSTAAMPRDYFSLAGYNGTHAVLHRHGAIYLVSRENGALQKVTLPQEIRPDKVLLTREGRELWVLDFFAHKVTRYAMPEAK